MSYSATIFFLIDNAASGFDTLGLSFVFAIPLMCVVLRGVLAWWCRLSFLARLRYEFVVNMCVVSCPRKVYVYTAAADLCKSVGLCQRACACVLVECMYTFQKRVFIL